MNCSQPAAAPILVRLGLAAALGACVGRLRRRRRPARFRRRLAQACGLPDPRHRRLQISGDDRLERGGGQRRQIRLDQGDRGRRPRRRALPGQLAGARSWPAFRTAPITSSIGAGRRSRRANWFEQNVPVEDDALPPALDVEPTPDFAHLPAPSRTQRDDRRHEGDARGNGAPFRQAADHLHLGRLLPSDPRRRRLRGLSDLGALDQAQPRRALRSRPWRFWQYQADGAIPGIEGDVDRNVVLRHARTMAGVPRRPE